MNLLPKSAPEWKPPPRLSKADRRKWQEATAVLGSEDIMLARMGIFIRIHLQQKSLIVGLEKKLSEALKDRGESVAKLRESVGVLSPVKIGCPDCGTVEVVPDVIDDGKPVSGECPECGDRLHFA